MDPTQSQTQLSASSNQEVAPIDSQQDQEMAPVQIKPESLPLDKKIQYLQKYNYYDFFEVDSFIDAQDSINQWCLGQVVQNDGKVLCIHFDGWSQKWDLYQKVNSYKVAPFRKYSKGYTGQNKVALRQNMSFSFEDLQLAKERIQKLIDNDFDNFTAHEITQYLRGNLYVYIDFLLQGGSQPYSEDQIDAINDLINNFLKLVVQWLKKLPSLMPLWSQVKVNSDLFLVDSHVALLHSSFELMETLKKIFGGCPRCIKYFVENDKDAFNYENAVTKSFTHMEFAQKRKSNKDALDVEEMRALVIKNEEVVFGQIINFVNAFAEFGGFDAIINYLKIGSEYADGEKLPFDQFNNFTLAFRCTKNILTPAFASSFVNQIKDIYIQRMNSMSDKELKEVDKETISRVLFDMRDFFLVGLSEEETDEIIERNQLQIALRFLKSTYLEKRLKGISDIKQFLDKLEYGTLHEPQYRQMSRADSKTIKPPKWLTVDTMKDWILREKVLEIVLGDNTHSEIVKRGCCILKFLAKQGHLPIDSVDLIWKSQIGKHEEEVRVVYKLISDLVPNMDQRYIDLFFQKIQEVPNAHYDAKFLEFLQEFTMRSLQSSFEVREHEVNFNEQQSLRYDEIINQREAKVISSIKEYVLRGDAPALNISEERHYGLPIFWDLIQDKQVNISQDLQALCLNSLIQILKETYSNPIRINYLVKALENLVKGESVVQSILVSQCVISEFERYEYNDTRSKITQDQALIFIHKQLDLVKIIIDNIKNYHIQVKEKVKNLSAQKKAIPEDVGNFFFVGKNTHDSIIQNLLQFLQKIITDSSQKINLGFDNINTLWEIFVLQPNFTFDQNTFLKWINNLELPNQQNCIFQEDEKKYLFTQILCKPGNVSLISYAHVKCFHKYFKMINQLEKNIEIMRRRMKVINYHGLIGLETLWQIAIDSENEKSREESIDLLVDLHLKLDLQSVQQQEVWERLISKCISKLQQQESDQVIINTIQLVYKFLDRYEGKKYNKNDAIINSYQNLQTFPIQVLNKSENTKAVVQVSYLHTVGYLRQKIAEAFEYQINEFFIILQRSNTIIDQEDDEYKQIKDFGQLQQLYILKNPNFNPDLQPKILISSNPQNYELLFNLLQRNQNPKLIEATWELLMKLPVNERLKEEIKELKDVSQGSKNWEKILDPSSTNKLLYSLQIITNQNLNVKDPKKDMWRYKFIQKGGFTHLVSTFISLQIDNIDANLTLKCIEKLISILYEFINSNQDLIKQIHERRQDVTMKMIKLIDLIVSYLIQNDKDRGYSIEDLTKRILQNKMKKNKLKQYTILSRDKQQASNNEEEEDKESQEYNQQQQLQKTFFEESKIVDQMFRFLIFTFGQVDLKYVVTLSKYEGLEGILSKACIQSQNFNLRILVLQNLKNIIISRGPGARSQEEIQAQIDILSLLLFRIQPQAQEYEERCFQIYDSTSSMTENFQTASLQSIQPQCEQLILDIAKFIMNREIKERNTQDQDLLMNGKMRLLKALLKKFPRSKLIIGHQQGLTRHLLHDCLFQVPQGGSSKNQNALQAPKSKGNQSRKAATSLLVVLSRDCVENLNEVLTYMAKFNQHPSWRTNKEYDWNISPMDTEKSSTGYVGLKNLGCICYMNSLFQQLFMISSFRNDLLSVRDPKFDPAEKDENMLYQLQMLFAGLLKSERQSVSPKGFCHSFKDWDGNPTNVMEQMDVEEFFNMIMDRIETAIKETPYKNTIQDHFGGKFASEMICKGCPHKYERSEPFLSISLAVKNKKSIHEGLQSFISGDMLEGDNAYKCEKCDKKVDALKRTCVKKPPKHLIIALRRFEFDYDKMLRVKVNDYYEFPIELDIEPYTQEGLNRREKLQKLKEERGEDSQDPEPEMDPLKYPAEYYQYDLSGIVVHSGTADSGHYYSFIKDHEHPESGKWYELNDHIVRDFDPNDIPGETFGGDEIYTTYNMQQMKSTKWRNAYLLFYTRKVPEDIQDSADEAESEASKNSQNVADKSKMSESTAISTTTQDVEMKNSSSTLDILDEIEEKIAYENTKYWQNRFLFGQEYPEFVKDLTQTWNSSCIIPREYLCYNDDQHITEMEIPIGYGRDTSIKEVIDEKIPINPERISEMEVKVFQFAAQYHLTINQRSQSKNCVKEIIMALKAYMNKNVECAKWLLNEFCNSQIIDEMFFQPREKMMKKLIVGLLYCAMIKVYELEKDKIPLYHQNPLDPANNQSVLVNLSLVLISNIFVAKKFLQNATHFFQLFARLSSLGPVMREFLCKCEVIGRLLEFVYDDVSPHKERFRDLSLINPDINFKPDIGLPTEIDKKQLSHQQDLIERRRIKQISEGPMSFKYLLEAVSNLLRHFKNSDPQGPSSPLHLDANYPTTYLTLHNFQKDLVIPEAKFLRRVFDLSKKTRSIKNICFAYTHFAFLDDSSFQNMSQMILNQLVEYEANEMRPYLMLLQTMLRHPGGANPQIQKERFNTLIDVLLEAMKNNQNYFKSMECLFDFLFKIYIKIPQVRDYIRKLAQQTQKLQFLQDWNQEAKFPLQNNEGMMQLYKRKSHGFQNPQHMMRELYIKSIAAREFRSKILQEIIGNQQILPPYNINEEIDMDTFEMQDYKFKIGEQIDIYYRKSDKLRQAEVLHVLDELIQIKYLENSQNNSNDNYYQQQNGVYWIGTDTEKILPFGTVSGQYLTKIFNHFHKQAIQRFQQNNQQTSNQRGGNSQRFGPHNEGYGGQPDYDGRGDDNQYANSDDENQESDENME